MRLSGVGVVARCHRLDRRGRGRHNAGHLGYGVKQLGRPCGHRLHRFLHLLDVRRRPLLAGHQLVQLGQRRTQRLGRLQLLVATGRIVVGAVVVVIVIAVGQRVGQDLLYKLPLFAW